jgi:hypothetical protein
MYVAVEKYQVLDRMFTTYLEDVIQCSQWKLDRYFVVLHDFFLSRF